jgi:hypothetical protein
MKTKILILMLTIMLLNAMGTKAQVYSANTVGYVSKTIPPKGFSLIANPLIAQTNTIKSLFSGQVVDGLQLFIWDSKAKLYQVAIYDSLFGWEPTSVANMVVLPGGGFFVKNSSDVPLNITFSGEVPIGNLHTSLVAGLQIVSSQVPKTDTIDNLGYIPSPSDIVYQWDTINQSYKVFFFDSEFGWDPTVPLLTVGESIFLSRSVEGSWDKTFNVNGY